MTAKEKETLIDIFSVLEDVRELRQNEILDLSIWLKNSENTNKEETRSIIKIQKLELSKVKKGISLIKKLYIQ